MRPRSSENVWGNGFQLRKGRLDARKGYRSYPDMMRSEDWPGGLEVGFDSQLLPFKLVTQRGSA